MPRPNLLLTRARLFPPARTSVWMRRVMYVSATAASEVKDLAYMVRLGMWGRGTPFKDFGAFEGEIEKAGTGAMELLAMDMKRCDSLTWPKQRLACVSGQMRPQQPQPLASTHAPIGARRNLQPLTRLLPQHCVRSSRGMFVSRQLSFHGCSFEMKRCALSEADVQLYDDAVAFWDGLLTGLEQAATLCGREPGTATRSYWGSHQVRAAAPRVAFGASLPRTGRSHQIQIR